MQTDKILAQRHKQNTESTQLEPSNTRSPTNRYTVVQTMKQEEASQIRTA